MCVSKRENHAHSDRVFHPLFLPRLSRAWLFRQARSCTSRVKTVPNAARSSGKTSFQPLPVFPTATAAFNGSIVDQLLFFFFFRYFFALPFFPPPSKIGFLGTWGNLPICYRGIQFFVLFFFFLRYFWPNCYSFVIETFLEIWNNRLICRKLNFIN